MSDWRELGECSGGPLSMWFPTRGETAAPAKAVCRTCDVRAECLEWALANSVQFGVWGGASEKERRRMRRTRRAAA